MGDSSISWTNKVWNCLRGCTRVSAGCERCYAEGIAYRFSGADQPYDGLVRFGLKGPVWTGRVLEVVDKLGEPLRWKKPCMVFVNSMSDVFHESIENDFIAAMYGVMFAAPHKFQILTKRHVRMLEWHRWLFDQVGVENAKSFGAVLKIREFCYGKARRAGVDFDGHKRNGPLDENWAPNLWLGVSVESQKYLDERVPKLLDSLLSMYTVRWISMEPQLEMVDLQKYVCGYETGRLDRDTHEWIPGPGMLRRDSPKLDWVVVGGESGHGARSFDIEWAREAVDQCRRSNVPVFVKQIGSRPLNKRMGFRTEDFKGEDLREWPEEIRVREYPKT